MLTISFAVLAKNALHLLMLFSRLIIFCGLFEWNLSKLWWKANTEPNGSTFFLPEPTVLPNWKENEMKKVHTSLTQHSCLMFIDRNTICMSNYCTQHTSYLLNTCYLVLKRILLLEGEGGSIVEGEELKAHVTNFYKMLFGFEE